MFKPVQRPSVARQGANQRGSVGVHAVREYLPGLALHLLKETTTYRNVFFQACGGSAINKIHHDQLLVRLCKSCLNYK